MLFKLAENLFPKGPKHGLPLQFSRLTDTVTSRRVSTSVGTSMGWSLLAKLLSLLENWVEAVVALCGGS